MEAYTDIHSHIIPDLDDGADGMEQALKMLKIARENNIHRIITTPHYIPGGHNSPKERRKRKLDQLRQAASESGIEIKLYTGNEIYYRNIVPQLLESGEILTLAESSYVLIEFNPMEDYQYIRNAVYTLHTSGYHPVLAHAERYQELMEKKDRIGDLIGLGGYIQVNAGSFKSRLGYSVKKDVLWMLKHHCIHFIASDSHNDSNRAPDIKDAIKYIHKKLEITEANRILIENPERVLRNESI